MSTQSRNKSWILPLIVILGLGVLYLGGWRWLPHFGGMGMGRHHQGMFGAIPGDYKGRQNPVVYNRENLSQSSRLYRENCSSCHGERGLGDGPVASSLKPAPANLSVLTRMPMISDGYLFWVISDGSGQPGSAMPAFKESLSETERWKIIQYLRGL